MSARPATLIESWLPIAELGVESQRERGASSALPPLYFLHVWWARRPLTVSRAAVLGSLLPAWSPEWTGHLRTAFPTEAAYHAWFLRLLGVRGDPVAARRLMDAANAKGVKLTANPFGYPRAFTVAPDDADLELMRELFRMTWGTETPALLDPMAGGGSIPFEALRYGLETHANELNPVATVILRATLDYPARFGPTLAEDLRRYGGHVAEAVERRLAPFYPRQRGESIFAYVWARTVACPTTGKPVPLSPNWWLQKGDDPIAVRVVADAEAPLCRFEIVRGHAAVATRPDVGTVRRGVAISPWTGDVIDGDYIKREAQAGRMGQQLYALGIKTPQGRAFRAPTAEDVAAADAAAVELERRWSELEAADLIPTEAIPLGNKTSEPIRYGMPRWCDLFSPRQLLAQATILDEVRAAAQLATSELGPERGEAVGTYLAFGLSKCLNYNSRMSIWHPVRASMANTFDRHDFSFKWSHGEFDAAHGLWLWALDQVVDAYQGIAGLLEGGASRLWATGTAPHPVDVRRGNASALDQVLSASLPLICVDPPYYDNVQYAELSDFFFVWMKRALGALYPNGVDAPLTDKDDEAVANPARFASFGAKRKTLAAQDYERKMGAAFREMHRVLRDDGVLTVMFTHKKVEAWDALATALIGAGFRIETSWPVHTESEHSLHQARKNAAASTILLVCRKREPGGVSAWWEDLQGRVRRTARERAQAFAEQGVSGVDLYIATFGPALSVVSEHWPVLTSALDPATGEPLELRPEVALDLARAEVIGLRKEGLLLGRPVRFDPVTDWYLMAWDAFRAAEFPADEARKLAIAVGIEDVEETLVRRERLIAKKQSTVVLQPPAARRKRDVVDPDGYPFPVVLDGVHTAMLLWDADGAVACQAFLKRTGLAADGTFRACVQALLNAIPRTRDRKGFLRPEAATLDALRSAFFPELEVPAEPEVELPGGGAMSLWDEAPPESDDEADADDEDDDAED